MSSAEPERRLSDDQRRVLLRTARESIEAGLHNGEPLAVEAADHTGELVETRSCFVTLRKADGGLRGCIGSPQPVRPLVVDVAHNAWAAAFHDPRFEPLCQDEFPGLHMHISVLGPLEPLPARSEEDLLERVRPGIDGLHVQEGVRRGTLLPAVWETLPDARRFVFELRRKAGLPGDYWSDTLSFHRYTAESFD
ncbi:MAG TPA: AmmeMemoRadiSam system protein A [Candidatus Latescibacteria bacterium]|jgi:AmmeMemoRadiSam system protein A|nr:AMMECR1 domain-containing protein [Gemmatimonadaceae bacterium]MDP6018276.1 AmmeMemoRadiSam system protein A [Candidatus Latescibacterota bacterium]HJP32494.1 AmmeMemoRadiSam system protein A [Candidatus Latescibacterota bacterium]